jgi:hypothetical protein
MGELIWAVWAVFGFGLEMLALYQHNDKALPTLTHVILWHAPRWVLAGALGWLAYHFLVDVVVQLK